MVAGMAVDLDGRGSRTYYLYNAIRLCYEFSELLNLTLGQRYRLA